MSKLKIRKSDESYVDKCLSSEYRRLIEPIMEKVERDKKENYDRGHREGTEEEAKRKYVKLEL